MGNFKFTLSGSHNQIMYLVGQSCIKPLCDNLLMTCPDPRILSKCLNGLENILKVGEAEKNTGAVNYYCQLIDDEKGQDKIETLRTGYVLAMKRKIRRHKQPPR
ncbi:Importin subunit alpha-1 [Cardamine amara subsp. amara]|uniref:Importin subunit alpha-1 n=1 Tax=Cardamine amara subsp. amara TaxID=228776 RepID=A0ABD1AD52_CARAN